MPVSNFQIKGGQVIGLKFDTKFPFWISFIQSKVFPVTIHLGKLFSCKHQSNWSALLLCKLLRFFIQYPCTQSDSRLFQFGIFLICFLTFLISICMPSCTVSFPNSFSTLFKQSVFSLWVTAWSHISLQKRLLCSASDITLSLCAPSNSFNNLSWFDSNNRFCLYCFVLLSYLSSFALTTTNLCLPSSWTAPAPFFYIELSFKLWRLHFAIPLVSFYLIVLTLCVIPSASLKFFFVNLVVCLLSSPCFCNPPPQQQHCQQHVKLSLFL